MGISIHAESEDATRQNQAASSPSGISLHKVTSTRSSWQRCADEHRLSIESVATSEVHLLLDQMWYLNSQSLFDLDCVYSLATVERLVMQCFVDQLNF